MSTGTTISSPQESQTYVASASILADDFRRRRLCLRRDLLMTLLPVDGRAWARAHMP
jgi:hypothetical protein